jgi:hypothetical protein|tara:strand:+ start:1250 stop:1477 length:228 start_codon:yes stop_codon:yes gene_type:complete
MSSKGIISIILLADKLINALRAELDDGSISLDSLGVSPDLGRTDQFAQIADRLPSVIGREPKQSDIDQLLSGRSI